MSKLEPKKITAPNYEYDFQVGWKNGIWHVYEPVSFDLIEPNFLLEKANRWVGRSASLAESVEQFELHLLIGEPKDSGLLDTFRKANNILNKMLTKTELVMEARAEEFAADLEREMAIHWADVDNLFNLL